MAIKNPHDALVKATFSTVAYAADEFRAVLPASVVELIDFDSLALCSGSFVDEALRDRHADLLFSASIAGREGFLWLLIEHQSTVDPWMALRLWWDVGEIWRRYTKDHPEADALPVVIPVVLHHSASGWTAPTSIGELLDIPPQMREALGPALPALRFYLDDLSVHDDEALRTRSMSALPRLALWVLKNARDHADFVAGMHEWRDVFSEVLRAANGVQSLAAILRYILQVSDAEPESLEAFTSKLGPDAKEAYMTGAEILQQRAREQTRIEERSNILQQLMVQRFGDLSSAIRNRIHHANADQLQCWIGRVVSAATVEDVFADSANDNQLDG